MNGGLAVGQHGLHKLVLGREQRLLRLQDGEQVRRALAVLQLGNLEGFARRLDQARQMVLRPARIGHLYQREFHIGIGIERGILIGGDEFLLRRLGKVFLPGKPAAIEDGLQQGRAVAVAETRSLQLSPQLFESELFGHRRGAFTDAKQDRTGFFRAATGGTLFLDEIGNVPLHLQSKLLTALERREVVPVGAEKPEPIDVRLIRATNLGQERLADENLFRQDLFCRINTVEITLPPLRERQEDIPQLLAHYAALYAQKYNLAPKRLSAALIDRLTIWPWPGNVRALRHAVERAVILSDGELLGASDFPVAETERDAQRHVSTEVSRLDAVEKAAIVRALERHKNNVSRAAEALGLTRTSLYRRMEKYGL